MDNLQPSLRDLTAFLISELVIFNRSYLFQL